MEKGVKLTALPGVARNKNLRGIIYDKENLLSWSRTMGSGMASNLLKAGYALTVWNRALKNANHLPGKVPESPALRSTLSAMSNSLCTA